MDVNMPELDGFELAQLIRQHPRCREAPRSSSCRRSTSPTSTACAATQTGAVDYVSVPVVPEILRAKIGVLRRPLPQDGASSSASTARWRSACAARTAELEASVAQLA